MCFADYSIQNKFVCVNCGSDVKALFKKYNPTVFKLTECTACSKIADKYVEYDGVIILIDLILFNKEAFRHIFYNTEFRNHWKLGFIILFLKIFNQWVTETARLDKSHRMSVTETAIYLVTAHTIIGCLAYIAVIFALLTVSDWRRYRITLLQWKAIVLSNISQFFLLPSLIWQDLNRDTHLIFVVIYSLILQIQALSVVTKTSRIVLCGILVAAFLAETFTLRMTRLFLT